MTYLLRLNLDIKEPNFKDQLRFKLAAASIKSLSKKTNKIVILSHLGRPKDTDKSLSLRRFAPALSKTSGKRVKFISHFDFPKIKKEIDSAPAASVFLLENLRFLPGEIKNSKALAKDLASLGTRYINNDFANSHRAHASMSAITKFLPSAAGPLLKAETRILKAIKRRLAHPFILIVGGGEKLEDKIGLAKSLLPKVDRVLIGSYVLNLAIDGSIEAFLKNKKVLIPDDWQTKKGKILDIGPETMKRYSKIIADARTIIWNGPMGYFEDKKFAHGTKEVARSVFGNKKARIIIGGAETIAASPLEANKQAHGRIFISTGGGAMLEFLAGKELPGIKALRRKRG